MLTPQDVRSVQFEKNLRGYRTEDVDRFLDKVEEQLRDDDAQAEQLRKQIADLTAENQKLHDELKSFEADGEMLKSALINAQRMGENVIREANQKANDRADEIENEANEKRLAEEREYDRVRLEVTRFKSDVLNLYRSHVESLSRLPEFQKETAAQDAEQAEPAAEESEPAAADQPQAADVLEPEAEPAQPAQEDAEPAAVVEDDDDKAADSSEDFWAKDESQLKLDPPPAPPADFKPDEPDYDAFQGVKFSE